MTASATSGGASTPRVLADRYRLDSVIGKGSMGTVWSATDLVLHRNVAIKEIDFPVGTPAAERRQLEQRTLREARAIAALSNPYVITLFDILTVPAGPVIVMELLHSRSLADILKRVGRLPDGQAATIGVAVASGLLAAHAAGITHRDVKPANVLICDDGRIKLTDFGIARSSAENTMTATGLLLGSPAYIAPEVASGTPAGPVSDAWSLGGLLFACVEGRPPFDQGTAIATLTSVVKDPVPPHPHSGRLGAVVSGLLVKTPNLRMRIEKALQVMRGIADDPSGTYLATVTRIPRSEWPGFGGANATGGPAADPGATGAHAGPAGRSMPPGRSSTPLPASASGSHGPASASSSGWPARSSSSAPAWPASSATAGASPASFGPPAGPRPAGQRGAPLHSTQRPPAAADSSFPARPFASSVGPPPTATGPDRPTATDPPRPPADSGQLSANIPLSGIRSAAGPAADRTGSGSSTGGQAGPGFAARAEPLPPPPWAQADAAALPPLPDQSPEPAAGRRIAVALVVALLAAVAGFFAVRLIADAADSSAAPAPVAAAVRATTGEPAAPAFSAAFAAGRAPGPAGPAAAPTGSGPAAV